MSTAKAFAVCAANYTDPAIIAAGSFLRFNAGSPLVVYLEAGGNYRRLRAALEQYAGRVEFREVNFPEMAVYDSVRNQYTEIFYRPEAMPAFAQRIRGLAEMRQECDIILNLDLDTLTLNHIRPAIMAAESGRIAAVSERDNRDRWLRNLGLTDIAPMPDYFNTGFAAYPAAIIPDDILREYAAFLRAYHDRIYCPEQDFLNLKFAGRITRIPAAYNLMFTAREYTITAPRIIHFLGFNKPWSARISRPEGLSNFDHYFPRYAIEAERLGGFLSPEFRTAVAENARRI